MNSWIHIANRWFSEPQLASLLVDGLLKSVIVLSIAAAVCLAWRRGAASVRHLVWLLAVAGLLCLPVLAPLAPAWRKPLWTVGARQSSNNELTVTLAFIRATSAVTPHESHTATPSGAMPDATAAPRISTQFRTGWSAVVIAVWALGAVVILASILIARLRLRLLSRDARPPSNPEWPGLKERLCAQLQIRRQVTVLQSPSNVMPATWGCLRPVVLLPAEAAEWPQERLRVVLLHELAHVKRWDCLTQLIAGIACALYWFNPLVWIAARQMCVERERACDDLVLTRGCKPSDYASHLLEISQTFAHVPRMAAIAIARPSNLENRIAAIVDGSRVRRASRWMLGTLCLLAVPAFIAVLAAARSEAGPATADARPWYDARLRAFFAAKEAQARQLAGSDAVAPEAWQYFDAGIGGDWVTTTNLWATMRSHAHQYEHPKDTKIDETLIKVWSPILETDLAWRSFSDWTEKYVLQYGDDIIKSIPPGSIYFGGTDPGRGVVTAMSESQADAKPFFTITQNALADGSYVEYLRKMYGSRIYVISTNDLQNCFQEYVTDAGKRLEEGKLKPGEDVKNVDGKIMVSGQVAVMNINALLAKVIFDHNTNQEFYIEESFPLDWMYPYLSPNGIVMKINREPLPSLSDAVIREDHEYWSRYLAPMIGDWIDYDTPVSNVTAFAEKVYLNHDLSGFGGDPTFVQDASAQQAYSKERSSIAGVYAWRATHATDPAEQQAMRKEADYAFRQALALCPSSPEAVFRYVTVLVQFNRFDDALLVVETSLKLDPKNKQMSGLLQNIKSFKSTH